MTTGLSRQVLVFLALLSLAACTARKEEAPIVPPATSPLSRHYIGYGVVNVSYTHITAEPARDSVSVAYLRRGSVAGILERRLVMQEGKSETWVLLEGEAQGWLREEKIDVYGNELQARTAAGVMAQ
jgi:mannose-6-phosphate isomerase-like protein (cupin superfamily)